MTEKTTDQNFSILILFQFFLVIGGLIWLVFKEVDSALKMIVLFFGIIVALFLINTFIKENSSQSIYKIIKIPFATDEFTAATSYLFGWLIISPTWFIGTLQGLMVPLAGLEITQELSSLSALQAFTEPFLSLFHTVFVAGNIEEFSFGWGTMIIGGLITMLIIDQALDLKISKSSKKNIAVIGGLILSISVFSFLHTLNDSYVSLGMFVAAAMFRFLMNVSIYNLSATLAFTIGVHQSNNFGWFIKQEGFTKLSEAILSFGGFMFFGLYFGILIIIVSRHPERILPTIRNLFKPNK